MDRLTDEQLAAVTHAAYNAFRGTQDGDKPGPAFDKLKKSERQAYVEHIGNLRKAGGPPAGSPELSQPALTIEVALVAAFR